MPNTAMSTGSRRKRAEVMFGNAKTISGRGQYRSVRHRDIVIRVVFRRCAPNLVRLLTIVLLSRISPLPWAPAMLVQAQTLDFSRTGREATIPKLPIPIQKVADRTEEALDHLISRPSDLDQIRRAIPQARNNLALHRKYQGDTWWQPLRLAT
jgi:hypothetical protein